MSCRSISIDLIVLSKYEYKAKLAAACSSYGGILEAVGLWQLVVVDELAVVLHRQLWGARTCGVRDVHVVEPEALTVTE